MRLKNFAFILFAILLLAGSLHAANHLYSENFDDQDFDQPSKGTITAYGKNWAELSLGQYSYITGRGGTGYAWGSGSVLQAYLAWYYTDTWPTDEVYVSFWMRYPTYTREYTNDNLKFFYPHFGSSTDDKLEYTHYYDNVLFWMHYNEGVNIGSGTAYLTLAAPMQDGNWHRYEWWWKFSTGQVKFWYDRPVDNWTDGDYLIVSETEGAGVWNNYMHYLSFGHGDMEDQNTLYTRFFDDIDVWDGLPNTSSPSSPTIRSGGFRNGCIR